MSVRATGRAVARPVLRCSSPRRSSAEVGQDLLAEQVDRLDPTLDTEPQVEDEVVDTDVLERLGLFYHLLGSRVVDRPTTLRRMAANGQRQLVVDAFESEQLLSTGERRV